MTIRPALALFSSLAWACASAAQAPAAEAPAVPTLVLKTDGGAATTGQRLAALMQERAGASLRGPTTLGWPATASWVEPTARAVAAALPRCTTLADLGAAADSERAAADQVDPSSFEALLWIEPAQAKDGVVSVLEIAVHSAKASAAKRFRFDCSPPLRIPASAPLATFARWAELRGGVHALAWEPGGGRLWADVGGQLVRLDPATRKAAQAWDLPAISEGRPSGPSVLAFLPDEAKPRVGWYDLGRGAGRWFEKGAEGFAPGTDLTTLPLPERVLRFLTPTPEGPGKPVLLTSYQGKDLARCVDVVRFMGRDTSCFACLTSGGGTALIRGDTLAVLGGPGQGDAAALTGWGHWLLVASAAAPFWVKGYALAADFSWETAWTAPLLAAAPSALCVGEMDGAPTLFVGMPDGAIWTTPLPKTGP